MIINKLQNPSEKTDFVFYIYGLKKNKLLMKRILLLFVFSILMFLGGIQRSFSLNSNEKWTSVTTESYKVEVYIKSNNDSVDFFIKTDEPIQYTIYDILGMKVIDEQINKEDIINKKLSKGLYLMRITDDKRTCIKKIQI
jgi:hypothetical protein